MKGYPAYQQCVTACLSCAVLCDHCALSCTLEEDVKMMTRCIQLDMECVAICYATARLMSLDSEVAPDICRLCAGICDACGKECAKHDHEHCRKCAEACQACARECRSMLQ